MNTINMPGFTAEYALFSERKSYVNQISITTNPLVILQAIDQHCWNRRFIRTFHHCMDLGGFSGYQCAVTAMDLADSVCDL
jgi:hypothetical protein